MKYINLLFFLLVVNLSFGQWVEREANDLASCMFSGNYVTMEDKIIMFDDSTGYRESNSSQGAWAGFKNYHPIINYGDNNSVAPSAPFNIWGSYFWSLTFDRQNYLGPEKLQLLDMNTLFYKETSWFIGGPGGSFWLMMSPDNFASQNILLYYQGTDISDFYFLDSTHGFINLYQYSSSSEWLLEYTNGILDTVYTQPNSLSSKIRFVKDSLGFLQQEDLILTKKRLMRSIDVGQNWVNVFDSLPADLSELKFVTDDIGFMTLTNNSIYKTIDKGASWTYVTIDYNRFQSVYEFYTENTWYATASLDSLFKTYNQGASWIYDSLVVSNMQDIEIRNDTLGYVIGTDCKMYTKGRNTPLTVGIDQVTNKKNTITVYPNPAYNKLYLKNIAQNTPTISQVFNINGVLLIEEKDVSEINISTIPPGIYILKISNDGFISHHKFIKN